MYSARRVHALSRGEMLTSGKAYSRYSITPPGYARGPDQYATVRSYSLVSTRTQITAERGVRTTYVGQS